MGEILHEYVKLSDQLTAFHGTANKNDNWHSFNDEPAKIFEDGTKAWCCNGDYHRENNPAIITLLGTMLWFKYGKRHNENGPAVIFPDGYVEYFVDGVKLTEDEFYKAYPNAKRFDKDAFKSQKHVENIAVTTKETTKMENTSMMTKVISTVKQDAIDGAWRTAAHQTLKIVKEPLTAFLTTQLGSKNSKVISALFETDLGEAAFAVALGSALNGMSVAVPMLSNNRKVDRLADELRKYG
jgi:hypothetical protein